MRERIPVWRRLIPISLRTQMLVVFIGLITLSTMMLAVLSFKTYERSLVDQIGMGRVDVLNQVGERAKLIKNSITTLSNLYYNDTRLNAFVAGGGDEEEFTAYLDQVSERYRIAFRELEVEYEVVLVAENGFRYSSGDSFDFNLPSRKVWYRDIVRERGNIFWVGNFQTEDGENYFSAARLLETDAGEHAGILMVNARERLLHHTYESVLTSTNNLYLIDNTGRVISCNRENMLGLQFFHIGRLDAIFARQPYTILDIGGRTVLFTRYDEAGASWTLLEEIPLLEVILPILEVRNLIVAITALIVLCGVGAILNISGRFTRPVRQLCDFIQQVQDDTLERSCDVRGTYEIHVLSTGLNGMLHRIRVLVENIREQSEQRRRLEMSVLQAQINPHFMYNTLFSIKCMVDMKKDEEASDMLTAFIQLLRSTLSEPDGMIPIRQEMETLRQYLVLQQFRYAGKFETVFDFEDEVLDCRIPKLLVQPLVENAIFHGVELKKDGLIVISARRRDDQIVVTVEDNGVGIPEAVKDAVEHGERLGKADHVGVSNVRDRIALAFGPEYGMRIESAPWMGTRIILTLPVIY